MTAVTCKAASRDHAQCPLRPVMDGWCVHHHPTQRLLRLQMKKARLSEQLRQVEREIAATKRELP